MEVAGANRRWRCGCNPRCESAVAQLFSLGHMSAPIFQDRISRRLIIWSFILFMIAAMLPTKDRFEMSSGGQQRVITRQDNPKIYWGVESGILFVAVSLSAYAVFRSRRR
jgi:hypothetical protein